MMLATGLDPLIPKPATSHFLGARLHGENTNLGGVALLPLVREKHWAQCVCFIYDRLCLGELGGQGSFLAELWLWGRGSGSVGDRVTWSTPLGVHSSLGGVLDSTLVTAIALAG